MSKPLGYSYIRFSTVEQEQGDSLRRQTKATEEWCERNGVALTPLEPDKGRSAFRGANRDDKASLGEFLRAINRGKVPKGSYLVIENLDRLTRQDERTALRLWLDILDAGVNIVQLTPETIFRHDKSDMVDIIRAIIEMSRAHSESRMKSKRNGETWEMKRDAARQQKKQPPRKKDGRVTASMTDNLPAWIEDKDGVLCLIPEKAAAVRRVFTLAANGLGGVLIVKELNRLKVPAIGPSGEWGKGYVNWLLNDRRAVGEFQPRHRDGRAAGKPIPGYYPACVSEEEWLATRDVLGKRRKKLPRGRVSDFVNVFGGLLKNAREGDSYCLNMWVYDGKKRRILSPMRAGEQGSKGHSFDLDTFERAVLKKLKEIDAREIIGDAPGTDEIVVLTRELEKVHAEQGDIEDQIMNGQAKALVPILEKKQAMLDAREKELTEKLDALRPAMSHNASEEWGETLSLIDALAVAPDKREARLKLRMLLRQQVTEIWVLVVPRTATKRLAAAQLFFRSGVRRDYLIFYAGAGKGRKGGWSVRSLATVADADDLDLRRKEDALGLEAELLEMDLAELEGS